MSHNTFRGMAVLALGMTCGVAFGQEADGAAAGADASFGVGAGVTASADSNEASAAAEADTSDAGEVEPSPDDQTGDQTSATTAPPPPRSDSWMSQLLPEDGMGEIGIAAGVLFPSIRHNFQDEDLPRQELDPAPELALRAAWFPMRWVGIEGEGAFGMSKTEDGERANPWAIRVHAVGQLPLWRITPFALMGFGRMGNLSDSMGSDGDPLVHLGAGAKLFVCDLFALRFDVRDNLTQKSGRPDGILAHSVELLLGASITLGRSAPEAPPPSPAPASETSIGY